MLFLTARIAECDERVETLARPWAPKLAKLQALPGVGRRGAQRMLAELGPDMTAFPSHRHAASGTGICPGNHESAGKRKSGKTRKGNRWLRSILVLVSYPFS